MYEWRKATPALIGVDDVFPTLHTDDLGHLFITRPEFRSLVERAGDCFSVLCSSDSPRHDPVLLIDTSLFDAPCGESECKGELRPSSILSVIAYFGLDKTGYVRMDSPFFVDSCQSCYFKQQDDESYLLLFAARNSQEGDAVARLLCPDAVMVPIFNRSLTVD